MNTFESQHESHPVLPQRSLSEVSAAELQEVEGGWLLPALVVAAVLLYSRPAR